MRAFDFPFETVEISCPACGRFGRYTKENFCKIVGRTTPLPAALTLIAKDCPEERPSLSNLSGGCRAKYPQLEAMNREQKEG